MIFTDEELKEIIIEGVEKYTDKKCAGSKLYAAHYNFFKKLGKVYDQQTINENLADSCKLYEMFDSIYGEI